MTVDAFAAGALGVDGLGEGVTMVKQDALQAASFPIGIFVAALPMIVVEELFTGLIETRGKGERQPKR